MEPSSVVVNLIATIVALGPILLVLLVDREVLPDCSIKARHYAL